MLIMNNKFRKCYSRKDKLTPKIFEKRKADFSLSSGNVSIGADINKVPNRNKKRKKHNDSYKENRKPRATYVSKPVGVKKSSYVCSNAKESKITSVFDDWEPSEDSPFSKLAKSVRKDPRLKFVKLSNFPSPTFGVDDKVLSSSSGCLTNSGTTTPLNALKFSDLDNSSRNSYLHEVANQGSNSRVIQPLVENILSEATTSNRHSSEASPATSSLKLTEESHQREASHRGRVPDLCQPPSGNNRSGPRTLNAQISSSSPVFLPSSGWLQKSDSYETTNGIYARYVSNRVRKNGLLEGSPSPIAKSSVEPLRLGNSNLDICDLNNSVDIIYSTPIRPLPVRKWSKEFKKRRQAIFLPSPPLSKTSSGALSSSSNVESESKKEESKNSSCESDIFRDPSNCAISPMNGILRACNQSCAINFTDYLYQRRLVSIDKVGEGVFSEVFGCLDLDGIRTVWKIQPFEGDLIVNGEDQKKCGEILTEVQITKCLSDLRNGKDLATDSFVKSLDFKCVYGPYPDLLLELWQEYDQRKGSENDSPSVFTEDQLLLLTELEYAGICMEDFRFNSSAQAISVFFQVAHALAIGELALNFEHRDLHWGNIMICRTAAKYVSFTIEGERKIFETKGVLAKIVDFTLSRASLNGHPVFADLSLTPDIFESTGEYQFEIYRLMKKHTENIWSKYVPYTNILWLHYLVLQICSAVKYRNKTTKIHKQFMNILKDISSSILSYSSATDFVRNQAYYESVTIQLDGSNLSN